MKRNLYKNTVTYKGNENFKPEILSNYRGLLKSIDMNLIKNDKNLDFLHKKCLNKIKKDDFI